MRCLIIATFVCLLWQSETRPVSNPLAFLMSKNESSEVKEYVSQILNTVMRHVTLTALGFPPTFEDFHKDMNNITMSFFLLSPKTQKELVSSLTSIQSAHKNQAEYSMDEITMKFELMQKRLNSPAARQLLEEVDEKFDFLTESEKAIEYIRNRDPEMAEILSNFVKEAKEQYQLLESEKSKRFIIDTLEYMKNKRENEVSVETLTHIQQKFIQLTEKERFDVVHRITWFMEPMWKQMHKAMVDKWKNARFGTKYISSKEAVNEMRAKNEE